MASQICLVIEVASSSFVDLVTSVGVVMALPGLANLQAHRTKETLREASKEDSLVLQDSSRNSQSARLDSNRKIS